MSRVSDTRLRTREAAARLVAGGRRPHDLTVDLIYTEIQQGSRTTINDELKLWKDEQGKNDVLQAALPPAVAKAMLNLWAVAVEHGESVFGQRREEVETLLAQASALANGLEAEKKQWLQTEQALLARVDQDQLELRELQEALAGEKAAKEAALTRASAAEQSCDVAKNETEQAIKLLKTEYQQRLEALQTALSTQEQVFRDDLAKATERLEAVQKHVMAQVTDAREIQKKAETQLAKAGQRNEQLTSELRHHEQRLALLMQTCDRAQLDLTLALDQLTQSRAERESLMEQLASATGKLAALLEQVESLERRAVAAETRLEAALTRPAATKKSAKPLQQG